MKTTMQMNRGRRSSHLPSLSSADDEPKSSSVDRAWSMMCVGERSRLAR